VSDFFGIPMTVVTLVALASLLVVVAYVAFMRWRDPILFEIGVRNIPRRRAQSVLIVLGLMLSTVIFAAALVTGDTVARSITDETYSRLGRVDVIVQARSNSLKPRFEDDEIAPVGIVRLGDIDSLVAEFNGNEDVDGILPLLRFPAPVQNTTTKTTAPTVVIMGVDPGQLEGFTEDITTVAGIPFDVSQLRRGEAVANESAARALGLTAGQRADIFVSGLPRTVTIVGIVRDRYVTGWTLQEPAGLMVTLDTAQFLFGVVGRTQLSGVSVVAISSRGGVRDSTHLSDTVTQTAIDALGTSRVQVVPIKTDRIDQAEAEGANLTAIFIVLGLFSIAAGMLLVFLIVVMLAAERRPEMGMSRAVGMRRGQLIQAFIAEGMAYSLAAAALGVALGVVVSLGMSRAMQYIFSDADVTIGFYVEPRSLLIAYAIGVVLTFATVVVSAWRVSRLSIVAAIREVNEVASGSTGKLSGAVGIAAIVAGGALAVLGLRQDAAALLGTGASLVVIGAAFVARSFGQRERPVFTASSAGIIALWVLLAGGNLEFATGRLATGLSTFFVGGVLLVSAATVAVIYNADVLLGPVRGVGLAFARAVPAVRTAVAYPIANRLRTGATIAMLSLVVFALVMISTMNLNFRKLFLDPEARGGWDIRVAAHPLNPFPADNNNRNGPVGEVLDRAFYDTRKIESIAQVQVTNDRRTQIAQIGEDGQPRKGNAFQVFGADDSFLEENKIRMQSRAAGYDTDREVWAAVKADPGLAVIDGSVVPGINYADITKTRFTLDGYQTGATGYEPIPIVITDSATGTATTFRVIGIMKRGPSETYRGLWVGEAGLGSELPPQYQEYYIKLRAGEDAEAEAALMQNALAQAGVTADSIRKEVEDQQASSSAFFILIQGFLAIGLGVGLVALTVIALRTVVERRQQIGLMRAIGFTRANIALSFVLESAFVAALGIINGIWPALLLANRLLASDEFSTAGFTTFHVPWLQIALMAGGVFVASVLTTIIPSRQAASIPPAEALRYE
jgi:putative ABC transport system permease protein